FLGDRDVAAEASGPVALDPAEVGRHEDVRRGPCIAGGDAEFLQGLLAKSPKGALGNRRSLGHARSLRVSLKKPSPYKLAVPADSIHRFVRNSSRNAFGARSVATVITTLGSPRTCDRRNASVRAPFRSRPHDRGNRSEAEPGAETPSARVVDPSVEEAP